MKTSICIIFYFLAAGKIRFNLVIEISYALTKIPNIINNKYLNYAKPVDCWQYLLAWRLLLCLKNYKNWYE